MSVPRFLRRPKRWFWIVSIATLMFALWCSFRAGPRPTISIDSDLPGIGKRTTIRVVVQQPERGLSELRAELVQGERVVPLEQQSFRPLEPWQLWGERTPRSEIELTVGSESVDGLREGEAAIRITAGRAPAWIRRPGPVVRELALPVKLRPPSLSVISSRTYVRQGGSEAVVYRVGEDAVEDGVRVGEWTFPGYPLPGGTERERFALFGVPFDFDDEDRMKLFARDEVGNEARVSFVDRFAERPFREDTIRISDRFLAKVVPEIMDRTPGLEDRGSPLDNYLQINNELRVRNNARLTELAGESVAEFLWTRPFLQARNAKVMSNFADRRSYLYDGKVVDRQDHLGFDLASVRRAEIEASNSGRVLLAEYLGIYGNAVLIDHGYGLMTLYGHLSSLAVEAGQSVERGETIGRSGETGLAGGDHLHFTVLLHGVSVNPEEWWDGHWIHDRLALKLDAAFPFEP